jgi:nicotinamide-nucleotide amidase
VGSVVLSVGSELLRGDIVDTNAAFLARELTALGIPVLWVEQIGDDLGALRGAVERAMRDAEVTVCTGGLGPTADDLTRQAIAQAVGEEPYHDERLVAAIEARFAGLQRPMTENNLQQALTIPSAEALDNPNGTAPGWYVRKNGRVIIAMPGPPREMEPMWRDTVLPLLEMARHEQLCRVALMTFGIGESSLEDRIRDVIEWRPEVTVATYAKENGVQVHVTARGATLAEARQLAGEAERTLRGRLGEAVFGTDDATLADAVGAALLERRLRLAVMESCTGGDLANLLTNVAGSSEYFTGGIVAYTGETKARYGVDRDIMERHGLISAETARAMARAARRGLDADIGIGTTGIAGGEPLEGKPPGTCFVAISGPFGEETREIHRPGARETVKRFVAQCALDLLRRALAGTVSHM